MELIVEIMENEKPRKKGLVLAEAYFDKYGRDMIKEGFEKYERYMAIGLVGEGSDCFGFDDAYSESHDFGPGFCIWLPDDIYRQIGAGLMEAYDNLPKTFENKRRVESLEGSGRVGVFSTQQFYRKYIGCSGAPQNNVEWLFAPETSLATVTNGKVFADHYGEFTKIRKDLLNFYPRDIHLKKLAARMAMMSQTGQYNYERCMKRKEYEAAYISCAEFIKNAVSIVYLLNKKYMPFYKWMFRGMDSLTVLGDVHPMLSQLAGLPDADADAGEKISLIEDVCVKVRDELARQDIISGTDSFLNNHARSVIAMISDEQIRNLPVMFDGK